VAQFRVEFVLDEASGMYLAELYHPENENEVVVRTEALYPTQAAAVLGVVQIFRDAVLQFPGPRAKPAVRRAKPAVRRKKPVKKKAGKKKPARKAAKRRKHC
jgi:hypothetical protein